ncbi:hypothetical protein [Saccharomonospora xinjiangensis]|uniref:hypothetical protein n=1 Tax=Saccharomonospora xinjiangensis TaxID=75294 RepID=UPI00106F69FC|nr:hypothetical protein [Saccharomonospora xinjiangensis]
MDDTTTKLELSSGRAYEYAKCAALLREDIDIPGNAAIFDSALSNGLAAIVFYEWPGREVDTKGKIKSARGLLNIIKREVKETVAGIQVLRLPENPLARS